MACRDDERLADGLREYARCGEFPPTGVPGPLFKLLELSVVWKTPDDAASADGTEEVYHTPLSARGLIRPVFSDGITAFTSNLLSRAGDGAEGELSNTATGDEVGGAPGDGERARDCDGEGYAVGPPYCTDGRRGAALAAPPPPATLLLLLLTLEDVAEKEKEEGRVGVVATASACSTVGVTTSSASARSISNARAAFGPTVPERRDCLPSPTSPCGIGDDVGGGVAQMRTTNSLRSLYSLFCSTNRW